MDDEERESLNNSANIRGVISSYISNSSDKSVKALLDKMLNHGYLTKDAYDSGLK